MVLSCQPIKCWIHWPLFSSSLYSFVSSCKNQHTLERLEQPSGSFFLGSTAIGNIINKQQEAGTKVLASQLSLDCWARRSGWVGSTTLISSAFTALLNCEEVGRRNRILTNYRFLSHSLYYFRARLLLLRNFLEETKEKQRWKKSFFFHLCFLSLNCFFEPPKWAN